MGSGEDQILFTPKDTLQVCGNKVFLNEPQPPQSDIPQPEQRDGLIKCPACFGLGFEEGNGEYGSERCLVCNGTGRIPQP